MRRGINDSPCRALEVDAGLGVKSRGFLVGFAFPFIFVHIILISSFFLVPLLTGRSDYRRIGNCRHFERLGEEGFYSTVYHHQENTRES